MKDVFLKPHLDAIAEKYQSGCLDSDPVGLVHDFNHRSDIEIVGLIAAGLALGRVRTIRAKIAEILDRMGGDPTRFLENSDRPTMKRALKGFRHRFFGENELLLFFTNIQRIREKDGTLLSAWPAGVEFKEALDCFSNEIGKSVRGIKTTAKIPLIPGAQRGSTAKRTLLFLRWMVRGPDGIDFGIWKRPQPSDLIIPMDTHIFKISRFLGLTERKTANWQAACEVTEKLRQLDAKDPVRYDFGLSRIGIIEACRGSYVPEICSKCSIYSLCTEPRRATGRKNN